MATHAFLSPPPLIIHPAILTWGTLLHVLPIPRPTEPRITRFCPNLFIPASQHASPQLSAPWNAHCNFSTQYYAYLHFAFIALLRTRYLLFAARMAFTTRLEGFRKVFRFRCCFRCCFRCWARCCFSSMRRAWSARLPLRASCLGCLGARPQRIGILSL